MEETYALKVRKTEEGISFMEDGNIGEFELMGIFSHLIQLHSLKLETQMKEYENSRTDG